MPLLGLTAIGTTPIGTASTLGSPSATITAPSASGGLPGVSVVVSGTAFDANGVALPASAYTWKVDGTTVASGVTGFTSAALGVLGAHVLALTVNDGVNPSTTVTRSYLADTAPTAAGLTVTGAYATIHVGDAVAISATGADADGDAVSLQIASNLAGALGTIASGAILHTTALGAGTHTITATPVDARGLAGNPASTSTTVLAAADGVRFVTRPTGGQHGVNLSPFTVQLTRAGSDEPQAGVPVTMANLAGSYTIPADNSTAAVTTIPVGACTLNARAGSSLTVTTDAFGQATFPNLYYNGNAGRGGRHRLRASFARTDTSATVTGDSHTGVMTAGTVAASVAVDDAGFWIRDPAFAVQGGMATPGSVLDPVYGADVPVREVVNANRDIADITAIASSGRVNYHTFIPAGAQTAMSNGIKLPVVLYYHGSGADALSKTIEMIALGRFNTLKRGTERVEGFPTQLQTVLASFPHYAVIVQEPSGDNIARYAWERAAYFIPQQLLADGHYIDMKRLWGLGFSTGGIEVGYIATRWPLLAAAVSGDGAFLSLTAIATSGMPLAEFTAPAGTLTPDSLATATTKGYGREGQRPYFAAFDIAWYDPRRVDDGSVGPNFYAEVGRRLVRTGTSYLFNKSTQLFPINLWNAGLTAITGTRDSGDHTAIWASVTANGGATPQVAAASGSPATQNVFADVTTAKYAQNTWTGRDHDGVNQNAFHPTNNAPLWTWLSQPFNTRASDGSLSFATVAGRRSLGNRTGTRALFV